MADNFDFLNSLDAADTELPKIERAGGGNGRGRQVQDNPFVGWLQESQTTEKGKSVTVQNRHAKRTEYLIRQAAEDLGIGVRVVRMVDGEQVKEKKALENFHDNKKVTLMFQAQKKRKYAPRTRRAQSTAPETAAE